MAFTYKNVIVGELLRAGANGNVVTTTKGDLVTHDGNRSDRLPVGADGQVVVATSSEATGLLWRDLTSSDVGLGNVSNNLTNYSATTDPTVNDDSSAGYSVGSVWFNQTTLKEFTLFDATNGAAVWVDTTATNIVAGDGLTQTGSTINVGGSSTIFANTDNVIVNSSAVANQVLLSSGTVGTTAAYGAIPLADANAVTGILQFANGGTGASSFTSGNTIVATNVGNTALVSTSIDPATIVTLAGVQTLTNKTLTNPEIGTSINDTNGNAMITLNPTVSAVNDITITNAATGTAPIIAASGSDTNIDLNIIGKGSGGIILSGNKYPTTNGSAGQVLATDGAGTIGYVNVQTVSTATQTTTNATPTTISSLTIPTTTDTAYLVEAKYIAKETSPTASANIASFIVRATFNNDGGVLTTIGTDIVYAPTDTTWSGDIVNSGTDIIIQVTGQASMTIDWKVNTTVLSI